MSGQINLYHPRYLKQREWLALGPVLAAALAFYLLLAIVAGWASHYASGSQATAAAADAQLKAAKIQVEAATKAAAERRPSSQLLAEVENVEALLRRRESIVRLLEGGAIGTTAGFSEHFRALARQAPEGLWLTGFSISAGGGDIRISGSTLHAAAVPDFIGRLGREKAFQGRSFSALTMQRPTVSTATTAAGPGVGAAGAAANPVGALIGALVGNAVAPAPTIAMPTGQATPATVVPGQIDFVLQPSATLATEIKP